MTIPDKLVQAAIEAANNAIADYASGMLFPDGIHVEVCKRAVAATLTVLSECEDLIMSVAEQMPHGWSDENGAQHKVVSKGNYNQAKAYLVAIAKAVE